MMIKSMTGFGRYEFNNGEHKVNVEVKAVNHRYLELNIKMPKKFNFLEANIRNYVKNCAVRGKIDMFITYEDLLGCNENVSYNKNVAKQYIDIFNELNKEFGIDNDMRASTLLRCQDVFTMEINEVDEDTLWEIVKDAVGGAMDKFVEARTVEGNNLKNDLLNKLKDMKSKVCYIEENSTIIVDEHRKKLEDKVKEMLEDAQIEQSRIVAETVIFADKICVDEEIVRLKSHIDTMSESLNSGGAVGRKLDFIAQEMNREANTILSKVTDINISNCAIDIKTEIEKIREQIQNIE